MATDARIAVVYSGAHGWVTDLGAAVTLTPLDTPGGPGGEPFTLPRYGIWKPRRGRAEVVATTDDLPAAIAEADRQHADDPTDLTYKGDR